MGVHLKNIFNSDELDKGATTEIFSVVQIEGEREQMLERQTALEEEIKRMFPIPQKIKIASQEE